MMIDFKKRKFLEPHSGKGNIIEYGKSHGAADIMFCEINKDLAQLCKPKARFLKSDFLKVTAEEISHIDLIVMNPPFIEATRHIQHAWDIAPEGCEIVSLINSSTLSDYHYDRDNREMRQIIDDYGQKIDLGNCFNEDAERRNNVEVSCIKLYKPIYNENTNFEGFYLDEEPEFRNDKDGVIKYNEIQALVNGYIGALKIFDELPGIVERLDNICKPVGVDGGFSYTIGYDKGVTNKSDFAKELQRKSWNVVFDKMNLNKYLTSGVMKDVNRFVENQSKIPFTVKNIYRMLEIIIGTAEHNFNRAPGKPFQVLEFHPEEVLFLPHTRLGKINGLMLYSNATTMLYSPSTNLKYILSYTKATQYQSNTMNLLTAKAK